MHTITRTIDIASNRSTRNYSHAELRRRILWSLTHRLFSTSPRIAFRWRNRLLHLLGAQIGREVHIYPTTRVYFPWNLTVGNWSAIGEDALIYNLGPISIGHKATISHRAHLCAGTHDYTQPDLPLLKPSITIADQAWICADAFIGPGVTVGEGAVVGACAVVIKNVEPWNVVAGNPARFIKKRELMP